jgi:hypothetical protein
MFRILKGGGAGLENYGAQFSRAEAETIVEADKPDLAPGQCRLEKRHHRRPRKPLLRTEMKDRADKAVAAISVMITASCPMVIIRKEIQHQIQYLYGFAGHVRGHWHLMER